jgi:hypothetical protein
MDETVCRACRSRTGDLVLDLGEQPAADHFPLQDDPRPDPIYPLQMWMCSTCGLAQLLVDPTVPEEPRGAEPAAVVRQAADAVSRVAAAGLLPRGGRIAEYGSPHGGSWLAMTAAHGLSTAMVGEQAEVVLDCFGLMHEADQATALAERAARVVPGGVLLLQYHSLDTIIRLGQWNALRHGHYAYYSTTALARMLAANAFSAHTAWQFDLYGGTVLLAASRAGGRAGPGRTVQSLLRTDEEQGVTDPHVVGGLQRAAAAQAETLREWLETEHIEGNTVIGYGAASRAVALLVRAGADHTLLQAVVDASAAKHGRRMPGTDIPIVGQAELALRRPDRVLVFIPELLGEVRAAFPGLEATGTQWLDAASLGV